MDNGLLVRSRKANRPVATDSAAHNSRQPQELYMFSLLGRNADYRQVSR